MKDDIAPLYKEHIEERQRKLEASLAAAGFDAAVIHSGVPFTYFADDSDAPFRPTPHFAHWLPLEGPRHLLLLRVGQRPLLVCLKPEEYWYEQAPLGDPFWLEHFDIREVQSEGDAWKEIAPLLKGNIAYVGPAQAFDGQGIDANLINPTALISRMDWDRSFKTPYEVACVSEASRISAAGHQAGHDAFLSGASELEIHQAYMKAVGCAERELPYETIVALNEKGAILHYQGKRIEPRGGKSLLLDAGAKYLGYASDITRTWAAKGADLLFIELLQGMERLQLELCSSAKPGLSFADFHHSAHLKIADLLSELKIITIDAEEAVQTGITKSFFPHGIGHFLGLQVHDVGGKQKSPDGAVTSSEESPSLRTTRIMEERQVFTVEPGVYLIEMLLRPHRTGSLSSHFNWELINRLVPYGGVRIEDNVLLTSEGVRNLTRGHLV